jgi:poly(3-hydroxybutyrate) depolymerase
MEINSTLARVIVCGASLLVLAGCGHDYASLQPDEVRVFKIPVGGPGPGSDSTLCLLSVPVGYTPDRSFPLLITLHGGGSNAVAFHDLWRPVTQSNGYLLATPQGGERGPDGIGYRWGPHAHDSVRRCIDVMLGTVNVDRSAIYLAGFSQGGRLAYALARSYPHVFAGVAAIGVGYDLPDRTAAKAFHNMRVYIGHGELEPGLEDVRLLADSLRAEGCDVELAVYRGTGHGIPQPMSTTLERTLRFLKEDD